MKSITWRLAGVVGSILIFASISMMGMAAPASGASASSDDAKRDALKRASGFAAPPAAKPAPAKSDKPSSAAADSTQTLTVAPANQKPVSAAAKKADEAPAADKPATDKPASEKPAAEKPKAEKPATEKPAAGKTEAEKSEAAEAKPAAAEAKPAAAEAKPAAAEPAAGYELKPVTWTLITAPGDRATTAPIRPPKKIKVPGTVIPISSDGTSELYLPAAWKAQGDNLDLVIHFHGAFWVVKQEAERVGLAQPLLMVNPGGPGSRYEKMFKDPESFDELLEKALKALEKSKKVSGQAHWSRVYLSSFSAGYAAIREILLSPRHIDMISGVALADSLHTAFDDRATSGSRLPRPAQMRPFVEFAQMAAEGKKIFVFSHSSILPDEYCGTPETAACLIAQLGGKETPAPAAGQNALRGMKKISTFERGGLKIYGYAGSTGPDHMDHFYSLGELLREFPIVKTPAPEGSSGKPADSEKSSDAEKSSAQDSKAATEKSGKAAVPAKSAQPPVDSRGTRPGVKPSAKSGDKQKLVLPPQSAAAKSEASPKITPTPAGK